MKLAHIGIIICLISIIVSGYFLFFKKEGEISTQTTTSQIEESKVFTPTKIKPSKIEILIYADKIEPSNITISLGEEVKWINKDVKDHIILLSNPPLEKRILAGDSFSFQFFSTGSVEFTDKETGLKGSITIS